MCTNSARMVSDLLSFVGADPTFSCRIHSMYNTPMKVATG
jgi:hypothetical protein